MTFFRKGTILMTRPSVIYFGPDANNKSKVFLRTLLISTAKRGRIIESTYLTLETPTGALQTFNIWVYGGRNLARGSGLFVGDTGVEANHHFLIANNSFEFESGGYTVAVYVHLLGDRHKKLLFSQQLSLSSEEVAMLKQHDCGIYFDWFPESSRYVTHIDKRKGRTFERPKEFDLEE
jgi:hypothetical protein